ncbi:MAG: hypothetical protein FWC41_11600 [Firmicutes bacterium]|nr:hypothetical protein [Bacillota bacterium]
MFYTEYRPVLYKLGNIVLNTSNVPVEITEKVLKQIEEINQEASKEAAIKCSFLDSFAPPMYFVIL